MGVLLISTLLSGVLIQSEPMGVPLPIFLELVKPEEQASSSSVPQESAEAEQSETKDEEESYWMVHIILGTIMSLILLTFILMITNFLKDELKARREKRGN